MCFQLERTNENDANYKLGQKYIDICEQNNPLVSLLAQRLKAIAETRREILRRQQARDPFVRDPETVRDRMPLNITYFPHRWVKTVGVFFPLFTSTQTELFYQQFAWFLAGMNDAGFERNILYELLRTLVEAGAVNDTLSAGERSAFRKYATEMVAGIVPTRFSRRPVALVPRRDRRKWEEWQSQYQPPSDLPPAITLHGISYPIRAIDHMEVDWWMDRGTIIVPKDGKTAVMLLKLRWMELWNFASTWNEIKSTEESWQNILLLADSALPPIQAPHYNSEPQVTWGS